MLIQNFKINKRHLLQLKMLTIVLRLINASLPKIRGFFWLHCMAGGISALQPDSETTLSGVEAQS